MEQLKLSVTEPKFKSETERNRLRDEPSVGRNRLLSWEGTELSVKGQLQFLLDGEPHSLPLENRDHRYTSILQGSPVTKIAEATRAKPLSERRDRVESLAPFSSPSSPSQNHVSISSGFPVPEMNSTVPELVQKAKNILKSSDKALLDERSSWYNDNLINLISELIRPTNCQIQMKHTHTYPLLQLFHMSN